MPLRKKSMVLTNEDIKPIRDKLTDHGDKSKLALFLGKSTRMVRNYFSFNKSLNGYVWNREDYKKALTFKP